MRMSRKRKTPTISVIDLDEPTNQDDEEEEVVFVSTSKAHFSTSTANHTVEVQLWTSTHAYSPHVTLSSVHTLLHLLGQHPPSNHHHLRPHVLPRLHHQHGQVFSLLPRVQKAPDHQATRGIRAQSHLFIMHPCLLVEHASVAHPTPVLVCGREE
jgi:hypothetical protein